MENYPLIPRSLEELEHIRHIIERRRIENAEKKLRRQILSENSPNHEVGSDIPTVITHAHNCSSSSLFINLPY